MAPRQARPPSIPATRTWLESQLRWRGIPGASIAIIENGRVARAEAVGVSDAWRRIPLTPDALMEVASHSKLVTALAALRAVEAGRLELDRPLSAYRPDFRLQGQHAVIDITALDYRRK